MKSICFWVILLSYFFKLLTEAIAGRDSGTYFTFTILNFNWLPPEFFDNWDLWLTWLWKIEGGVGDWAKIALFSWSPLEMSEIMSWLNWILGRVIGATFFTIFGIASTFSFSNAWIFEEPKWLFSFDEFEDSRSSPGASRACSIPLFSTSSFISNSGSKFVYFYSNCIGKLDLIGVRLDLGLKFIFLTVLLGGAPTANIIPSFLVGSN